MNSFGKAVHRLREAKGFGLRELAEKLGVFHGYLRHIEEDYWPKHVWDFARYHYEDYAHLTGADPQELLEMAVTDDLAENPEVRIELGRHDAEWRSVILRFARMIWTQALSMEQLRRIEAVLKEPV